jgi:hypothetical protein
VDEVDQNDAAGSFGFSPGSRAFEVVGGLSAMRNVSTKREERGRRARLWRTLSVAQTPCTARTLPSFPLSRRDLVSTM